MVALKMKKKEQEMKESAKEIVAKYEEALEHLGRENKRLQTSLKDMVSTNRLLRDQNKVMQTESDEKDQKIEELSIQIRQVRLFHYCHFLQLHPSHSREKIEMSDSKAC